MKVTIKHISEHNAYNQGTLHYHKPSGTLVICSEDGLSVFSGTVLSSQKDPVGLYSAHW